jgi:hypothetical protein
MNARFVMCINSKGYERDLTLHKVYKVISSKKEEQGGWLRIVDETGENYLYSAKHFAPVELSEPAEQSFDLTVA